MSTWPAMTAGPSSPGVGPPLYQPAGKPPDGTSIDPSFRRPRFIRVESTLIEAICTRTGVDLARWKASTTGVGALPGAGADVEPGVGADEVRPVAAAGGATAPPVLPEHAVAPMVTVANNVAAVTIVLKRARRGRLLTTWFRTGLRFFSCSDDADVRRRRCRRPQRATARRPADPACPYRHRWCCRHRCEPRQSGPP